VQATRRTPPGQQRPHGPAAGLYPGHELLECPQVGRHRFRNPGQAGEPGQPRRQRNRSPRDGEDDLPEFGGMRLRDTQIMTEIIRHLIGMIRADYHFPEDLVYEDRLITNLKFMLNRLIQNKEGWITEDARFNEFVRANYRNEYELARAMRDYIESVVSCKMTEEEVIYLAVQLKYADIKKKEGKKNGIF